MSEQLREALSAAVDGEASEFELRRVFDELAKDDGLAQAWRSYHLIKQAAQGENVRDVAAMSERIWASIDAEEFLEHDIVQEEPPSDTTLNPPRRRWGLAGGAIAAALALGVLLSGGYLQTEESVDVAPPADQLVENSAPDDSRGLQTVALPQAAVGSNEFGDDYDYGPGFVPYSELSPADQLRSEGYFLHHVQHRAVNNDNVLSFVKMISYPQ